MDGMYDLDLQHDLPGVPGVVFDHLTRIELLTTWWPSSGETDPRPGGHPAHRCDTARFTVWRVDRCEDTEITRDLKMWAKSVDRKLPVLSRPANQTAWNLPP